MFGRGPDKPKRTSDGALVNLSMHNKSQGLGFRVKGSRHSSNPPIADGVSTRPSQWPRQEGTRSKSPPCGGSEVREGAV